MPKRTSKVSRDVNELAAGIVEAATSDGATQYEERVKNPHAVALGRLGGEKGGIARAVKLTSKKRSNGARISYGVDDRIIDRVEAWSETRGN